MEKLALATLTAINPNLSIVKFQTFQQQIDERFTDERMIARLTSLFGGLALLLVGIGLYGVTACTVVRRTPEIGVRMALGAKRGRVIAMVMRDALVQALIGLVIGVPLVLLCVRYIKSQLYEITTVNPIFLAGAIVILGAASAIAGVIPARRAASIDPVLALRVECDLAAGRWRTLSRGPYLPSFGKWRAFRYPLWRSSPPLRRSLCGATRPSPTPGSTARCASFPQYTSPQIRMSAKMSRLRK
jgi:predicted lysophospholipase L1 biosynthesis ABC-type transport system permease subunit